MQLMLQVDPVGFASKWKAGGAFAITGKVRFFMNNGLFSFIAYTPPKTWSNSTRRNGGQYRPPFKPYVLLPGHRHCHRFFRLYYVISLLRGFGNRELNPFDLTIEAVIA